MVRAGNTHIERLTPRSAAEAGPHDSGNYSGTFWPLPMTTMPFSVTWNPRARS